MKGKRDLFVDAVLTEQMMQEFFTQIKCRPNGKNEEEMIVNNFDVLRDLALSEIANRL